MRCVRLHILNYSGVLLEAIGFPPHAKSAEDIVLFERRHAIRHTRRVLQQNNRLRNDVKEMCT